MDRSVEHIFNEIVHLYEEVERFDRHGESFVGYFVPRFHLVRARTFGFVRFFLINASNGIYLEIRAVLQALCNEAKELNGEFGTVIDFFHARLSSSGAIEYSQVDSADVHFFG